ncbi:MAG: phosphoribosylformylglycinamidine synthase [Patescibacteria group bacterium]|nr:phosphoribosylformylglycinamidine synthase [Patescibacteria group bacterium]
MIIRYFRLLSPSMEMCFNVEVNSSLTEKEESILTWFLSETFQPENLKKESSLTSDNVIEIGPRLNFATPWNTNALAIFRECGLSKIVRIERSRRLLKTDSSENSISSLYDRMTECLWEEAPQTFFLEKKPEAVFELPLLEKGLIAFSEISDFKAMDEFDRQAYYDYFVGELGRNPTIVEIMDLNNANSEHSRHGYFKAKQIIDGVEMPETLMEIVKSTLQGEVAEDSLVAFCDNSSVIRCFSKINTLIPKNPGFVSGFLMKSLLYHHLFTAETHNFPSGIAPFPGAETGTGGRIRDVQATGIGGLTIAGTAGYCVGNLNLPFCKWERLLINPQNLASPPDILIQASNGTSDYGNKFGEPVFCGFVRTSAVFVGGERREWLKPIMFTGGIGQINSIHLEKESPKLGMSIVQIGGPAYRIGFGGGSASSLMQGENRSDLDFNAVQRGDAEMEQKMNRIVRACSEMGEDNPIISLHDQGAGGPANVLKELVEETGGKIDIRKIQIGDPTMSVLEIWVCEYQERLGLVIDNNRMAEFQNICLRERVNCEVLGEVLDNGHFIVVDSEEGALYPEPVNMDLKKVLGGMPQKTFTSETLKTNLLPIEIPEKYSVLELIMKVLQLPSVGSKAFLTNKVDRSVTGLVAQQQCCGPLQLPVSDYAVVAQSHFKNDDGKYSGAVTSIGEQPIKMLLDPAAGARMAVGEAFTNLIFAKMEPESIKCSANWMGAPKLPGEGSKMYSAATAMRDLMLQLKIAVDGGKDSLSMATKVTHPDKSEELVKSPLQLVISTYAPMEDITKKITPDLKNKGGSVLLFIDLAGGKKRLGGSALAQVLGQVGDDCPDVEDPNLLLRVKWVVDFLIEEALIDAGHDVSDGGLITTLLEMAFSGDIGIKLDLPVKKEGVINFLFAEELGVVIEVKEVNLPEVLLTLKEERIPYSKLGKTLFHDARSNFHPFFSFSYKGGVKTTTPLRHLLSKWSGFSHEIERLQSNPATADQEFSIFDNPRVGIKYLVSPSNISNLEFTGKRRFKVAIIRAEGSNGDREMTSAFYLAGFNPYDVHLSDLLSGKADLNDYRGIAFVGGFSYADVLDSAKGWAGIIKFNEHLKKMFTDFYNRPDTFSLGICNGCQLSTLLGWVPFSDKEESEKARFIKNDSGRFESRWVQVGILPSPAIMLQGMEGEILGVWSAHGEGKFFSSDYVLEEILYSNLAPIRYMDYSLDITEKYPFNPNGSVWGIAGLCDPSGRHLAMMPHPERSFLNWQWPCKSGLPENEASPWLRMFINARKWCENNE